MTIDRNVGINQNEQRNHLLELTRVQPKNNIILSNVIKFLDPQDLANLMSTHRSMQTEPIQRFVDAQNVNPEIVGKQRAEMIQVVQVKLRAQQNNIPLNRIVKKIYDLTEELRQTNIELEKRKSNCLGKFVWKLSHATGRMACCMKLILCILKTLCCFIRAKYRNLMELADRTANLREQISQLEQKFKEFNLKEQDEKVQEAEDELVREHIDHFTTHRSLPDSLLGARRKLGNAIKSKIALQAYNQMMAHCFATCVPKEIVDLFPGGLQEYRSFPIYTHANLKNAEQRGFIPSVLNDNMTHPIMRGMVHGRRFICMRVVSRMPQHGNGTWGDRRAWVISEQDTLHGEHSDFTRKDKNFACYWMASGRNYPILNGRDITYLLTETSNNKRLDRDYEAVKKWTHSKRHQNENTVSTIE